MTNAELIAKIKAEIERRITDNTFGAKLELIDILAWLDTLESEKPIPNDLEEAAKEYAKTTFKKPHSDNPDEEVTIVEPDKYAGFIAGAKWQYQKDRAEFAKLKAKEWSNGYNEGIAKGKEQMMKEAVEGLICATITGTNAISFLSPLPKELTAGDKVKLIICKED